MNSKRVLIIDLSALAIADCSTDYKKPDAEITLHDYKSKTQALLDYGPRFPCCSQLPGTCCLGL